MHLLWENLLSQVEIKENYSNTILYEKDIQEQQVSSVCHTL